VIVLILVLDVLSSISSKKTDYFFIVEFDLTHRDTSSYRANWSFFLIIEIIGYMCLALLFVALRKIMRHVNEQAKILNNQAGRTTLEFVLNTRGMKIHYGIMVIFGVAVAV